MTHAWTGLAVAWLLAGCAPISHGPQDQPGVRDSTLEPGMLATVEAATVALWPGAVQRPFEVALRTSGSEAGHARRFGVITRSTALRTRSPNIVQYSCRSCHFGRTVVMADQRITDAHQNIAPVHPAQVGAVCSTCHSPDDVERLALKGEERPTFDNSYRLCAQCHFRQAEAWAGGAHGKRLDGWQGRRVVMACTDCHDPHRPALTARVPFRAPQLQRPRGTTHER